MFADKKTTGTKIVLDAYNWRAHIGGKATETRGNEIIKLVETQTLWGTTYLPAWAYFGGHELVNV